MRDYQLISPSLEGILSHYSVVYDGVKRPTEILRALDGPARRNSDKPYSDKEKNILESYFHDISIIFMKRLSLFISESEVSTEDSLKLQAMLQELLKIKSLISKGKTIQ